LHISGLLFSLCLTEFSLIGIELSLFGVDELLGLENLGMCLIEGSIIISQSKIISLSDLVVQLLLKVL